MIRRFERSDAIEIRDGITFDFYTGLPQLNRGGGGGGGIVRIVICVKVVNLNEIRGGDCQNYDLCQGG